MKDKPQECTKYYSDQVCDAISKLSQRLDWNVIDKVLQAIHDSDSVAFFWNSVFSFCSVAFSN